MPSAEKTATAVVDSEEFKTRVARRAREDIGGNQLQPELKAEVQGCENTGEKARCQLWLNLEHVCVQLGRGCEVAALGRPKPASREPAERRAHDYGRPPERGHDDGKRVAANVGAVEHQPPVERALRAEAGHDARCEEEGGQRVAQVEHARAVPAQCRPELRGGQREAGGYAAVVEGEEERD
eukprot:CAMPEP_0179861286 /NCGR_PEP_ID=MMETSP0982-20121206/14165_1 /TAXON_ID=483367 /ORGANISM="non described non described, Strain CCMP 2436" /LENGTH=181 /DNA_ID=CAMNT_0021748787 /DNA_START=961 /DNA_END=1505 /DNA_ORIENTATION=-